MGIDTRGIETGSNVRLKGIAGEPMVVAKIQQGTTGVTHAAVCWRYENGVLVEQLIPLHILERVPPQPLPSYDEPGA